MVRLSITSWRASAACIACGLLSHILVEPSMSVNRKVRVPVGGLAITILMSSLLPLRGHYSSGASLGSLFAQVPGGVFAAFCRTRLPAAYQPELEGDRRSSNPRPSE